MTEMRGAAVAAQPGRRPGTRRPGQVRTAVVSEVVHGVLRRAVADSGRTVLDVVDAGGGTGGFAVPLAELGHRVTVVDASLDALAALERRAADAGVRVHALQGDATDLPDLVGPAAADLVLCHSVLEYVDDPADALAALTDTVRPGGAVSVLAAGQLAAALHRALGGHFDEARQLLSAGAAADPVPRRFSRQDLEDLVRAAGLRVAAVHGVRVFADLVSTGTGDGDHESAEALIALETAAASHPVLRDLATQLHLLAYR